MTDHDPETELDRARAGDPVALEAVLLRHLPAVEAMLRLHADPVLRGKESIHDLAQSVVREVLEHLAIFAHGGEVEFRRWLLAMAFRKVHDRRDFWRAARRTTARERVGDPDGVARAYATLLTPSQVAMTREEVARLEAAFDRLDDEARHLVIRARFLGLSHQEIAAEDGIQEGTVRVRLHRALARLAEGLV